jgi:hypothetical protein
MSRSRLRLAAALLLLAASAVLARPAPAPGDSSRDAGDGGEARDVEPLARALGPLGPVRALVSSALWSRLLHDQMTGDAEEASALARALLALHPGLATVREYLAGQLLVTEAPRAPDRARHDALVATGLALFEEGLARPGGAALRAPFGRTLAVQSMVDSRFAAAAEPVLGEMPEERALRELLASGPRGFDRWLAANLAVEQGLAAWRLDGDRAAVHRALQLARELLPRNEDEALAAGVVSLETEPREILERAARLVAPLHDALGAAAPPPRPAPEDPAPQGVPQDAPQDAPHGGPHDPSAPDATPGDGAGPRGIAPGAPPPSGAPPGAPLDVPPDAPQDAGLSPDASPR